MRRTMWYVLFVNAKGEGQPAFVEGGQRRKAVARVSAELGPGWKLDHVSRCRLWPKPKPKQSK